MTTGSPYRGLAPYYGDLHNHCAIGYGHGSIHDSFREHFDVIRYWADVGKPCEINDPHQWGLRYASDDMQLTDHVLVGLIALMFLPETKGKPLPE